MAKINLSFIQYGGLAYGGAQKQAINLAKSLNKEKFSIRYFWSQPVKDLYSNVVHPKTNTEYIKQLTEAGIEPVEFNLQARDISHPYHPWIKTNFFEIFEKYETDIIFSVRAGHTEFPFVHLNYPIVEWNVFGQSDSSSNVVASVAVSPWVEKEFLKNGGHKNKSSVCFPAISNFVSSENLKSELNIKEGEVVLGFHQRVDDGIFGRHALEAFKIVQNKTKRSLRFFVLGGSDKYKALAKELNINVEFLPLAMDYERVSKFLNTLDIFCHSAGLGESVGLAVMEAMMHSLPVVSIKSWNNGHVDVIGNTNKVSKTLEEYAENLLNLVEDPVHRIAVTAASKQRAIDTFSFEHMQKFFEDIFEQIFSSGKKTFPVLPQNIYNKFSLYRFLFRALNRYPKVYQMLLPLNRKFKDIFK